MADGGFYNKPQRLNSTTIPQNKKNPSKFYNHFVFKTIIVTIFVVITLFFPSEPPDFVTPSAFFAKSWELVHLIFVGIAVSYGLFSRRNDESDGENNHSNNVKFDSAQSYMSRLLQVTSAFDDEIFENPSGFHDNNHDHDDENENVEKMQTWSSKYSRNEPMLVVTEKSSVLDQNSGVSGGGRPLLLPVRSLKTRVSDEKDCGLIGEEENNYGVSQVYTRSNTSSSIRGFSNDSKRMSRTYSRSNFGASEKGFSSESKGLSRNGSVNSRGGVSNGDNEVLKSLSRSNSNLSSRGFSSSSSRHSSGNYEELYRGDKDDRDEKKIEEPVVLPSPIPWRSRSGRMELKGELDDSTSHLLPPSLEESEAARSLKTQSSWSRSGRSEMKGELDDSSSHSLLPSLEESEAARSLKPQSSWSRSGRLEMKEELDDSDSHLFPPSLEESEAARSLKPQSSWSRSGILEMKGELDESETARSLKPQSSWSSQTNSSSSSPKELSPPPSVSSPRKQLRSPNLTSESQAKSVEDSGRRKNTYSSRLPPPPPPPPPPPHPTTNRSRLVKSYSSRDVEETPTSLKELKRSVRSEPNDVNWESSDEFFNLTNSQSKTGLGVDSTAMGKSVRTVRAGETRTKEVETTNTDRPERNSAGYSPMSGAGFSEFPKETSDFLEQVLLESDDDSESDCEHYELDSAEATKVEEAPSDVDKKADEFIAKFREQIRLQRIESIKKSTGQLKRTTVR